MRGSRDWHDVNQRRALHDSEGVMFSGEVCVQCTCRDDFVIQRANRFGPLHVCDSGLNEFFDFTTIVNGKFVLDLGITRQVLDPWLGIISAL